MRVIRVRVEIPKSVYYRKNTAKGVLLTWALERGEFTNVEFFAAAIAFREAGKIESRMSPEQMARAWWGEFYSKYRYFKKLEGGTEEQNTEQLAVRITPTLRESVDRVAQLSGLTQSDWIRGVLARAAHERAFAPTQEQGRT